jgi:gluconate kinase
MKTQKLLDEETERNKDNIAHCEALQKHYDDRVTAYEVQISTIIGHISTIDSSL